MGTTVSCFMPTKDRRPFVPRAVACFLAQTYDHRELLIMDDGDDKVEDLIPDDPRIRYLRSDHRVALGQKLEWMAQVARGDYFALWDDDDWHGPTRLERQMEALRTGPADVVLLNGFVGYDQPCDRAYVWNWRAFGSFADGTGAFSRRFYRNGVPFSGFDRHPGQVVLRGQPFATTAWIDGADLYVQVLHTANSATKHMQGPGWIPADAAVTALTRARLGLPPA